MRTSSTRCVATPSYPTTSTRPFRPTCVPYRILASPQLVKTLVDQAHLCPLPLHVRPVYWQLDHVSVLLFVAFNSKVLHLTPLPDVLILADQFDAYNLSFEVQRIRCTFLSCSLFQGCTAFNPGAFALNDGAFQVYWPAWADPSSPQHEQRVEFSKVD